jgi:23S rRNA (adenine2503-C2)-methyltransferase
MTELPAAVRTRLAAESVLDAPPAAVELESTDGFTRKSLLTLSDEARIETVLMRFSGRVTACVSSQAGCAMGCTFCATGQMGYTRDLTAGEIVAQAAHVARRLQTPGRDDGSAVRHRGTPGGRASLATSRLRNVVFMGMGEPLRNYEAVMRAVEILSDPAGLAIAGRHITISTVGVVPGILRLASERRQVRLAVSLHAATQEGRAALVPVAGKWPLDALLAACRTYSETTGYRIFYEWALIDETNDSPADARALGRLLDGLPAHVNLIPLNPTDGYAGAPARHDARARFQQILADEFSVPSTLRQRRGLDIAAGCGQLALTTDN